MDQYANDTAKAQAWFNQWVVPIVLAGIALGQMPDSSQGRQNDEYYESRNGNWSGVKRIGDPIGDFVNDAAGAGKFFAPDGKYYSTAFRTKLPSDTYPGGSYAQHFRAANKALVDVMVASPEFAKMMDELIPGIRNQLVGPRGGISPLSPEGWVWHHNVETGIMDLVPKGQHTPGSIFWNTLHPNGVGGMATWN